MEQLKMAQIVGRFCDRLQLPIFNTIALLYEACLSWLGIVWWWWWWCTDYRANSSGRLDDDKDLDSNSMEDCDMEDQQGGIGNMAMKLNGEDVHRQGKMEFPPDQLLEKGRGLMAVGRADVALQFFARGLERDSQNTELLEAQAEACMEMGDVVGALEALDRCTMIAPMESGTVWMYKGQLQGGMDAVRSYENGIKLLQRDLANETRNDGENSSHAKLLNHQLAGAFCSISELFMTDLCFEEDAEQRCDEAVQEALKYGPDNPQTLQALASFRLSQNRPEEARSLILRAVKIIKEMVAQSQMAVSSAGNEKSGFIDEEVPPFEFRVCTARILLEVGESTEAVHLLESLLQEDDEIVEVWILLGQSHQNLKDLDAALECLNKANALIDYLSQSTGHTTANHSEDEGDIFIQQRNRIQALLQVHNSAGEDL